MKIDAPISRLDFLRKAFAGTALAPVLLQACSQDTTGIAPAGTNATGTTTGVGSTTGTTTGNCVVTDTETDGPYPLYNSRGSALQRVDIREGKTGLQLDMVFTVKNVSNSCALLPNARVDIWYCDKDGYYSGYSNSGYLGTQNNTTRTFLRGLQYADASGQVTFTGIYPGWYQGRATHLHVQVYVDNSLKLTTQVAFPEEINTAVYTTDLYKAHGQNSLKNTGDGILRDSLGNELATVVANATSGGIR
ncbi:intradiol ring-cleavage dioxygenase [Spirosoma utsteinense]|uniref:Protocatechuate 3,4-dioxygenase beta subunit n=1 Tax=Spirosoma utsteinense TaxID=2585773 RepID=A0ABR6VZU7_9BACT|nr:intradiol ring-cleavage dioxygenase [Spirosoma utsteinense]MBC3789087.1 protocatechuate 3,4-dioxygenase beta subunit [Spirosoma utsteinense]MBC3789785.1 protocatechuate 3,4-dioxygenase beta subunit [Spirosoma utsteinense]